MKKWIRRGMLILGISLCSYPMVANKVQKVRQDRIIETYENKIEKCSKKELDELLEDARDYNRQMFEEKGLVHKIPEKLLSFSGEGVIGEIYIPQIGERIPIYHGTSEEILAIGVGHLEQSSLPVGGENTHCVLTGHRGLPNAKIFTRLDEMQEGDFFIIKSCGEEMKYKVRDINVIRPEYTKLFEIERGNDLVSLVTCTPYGINTHRLVVTGVRVEDVPKEKLVEVPRVTSIRELVFTVLPFIMLGSVGGYHITKRRKSRIAKKK